MRSRSRSKLGTTLLLAPCLLIASSLALAAAEIDASKLSHWSFQPVVRPQPPTVQAKSWVRNDLDRFVLARLEQASLAPSPEADRVTLIRRLYFVMLGMPPTPT